MAAIAVVAAIIAIATIAATAPMAIIVPQSRDFLLFGKKNYYFRN